MYWVCFRHVSAQKVDRDYLTFALSMKLDKKEASELIDMKYFNHHAKFVELSLEEVKNRLKVLEQESNFKYAYSAVHIMFLLPCMIFIFLCLSTPSGK